MSHHRTNGAYEVVVPPPDRQLAIDAFAALPPGHPMVGLLELDVTEALATMESMRSRGGQVSLFAFVVRCIAVAVAEHPDLNLVCHGRRLVRFEDVDVSVPVEVQTPDGPFPRMTVLRRAQDLTPGEIYRRLSDARARHERTGALGAEDRWVHRLMKAMSRLPRFVRVGVARMMMNDAFTIKNRAGTTLVTSVGKFADIPGFSFSFTTGPRASSFVVGSVVDKPWLKDGVVTARSILSLAIMVNHDLVDGAPAARFGRRLRELIESGEGLDERTTSRRETHAAHRPP